MSYINRVVRSSTVITYYVCTQVSFIVFQEVRLAVESRSMHVHQILSCWVFSNAVCCEIKQTSYCGGAILCYILLFRRKHDLTSSSTRSGASCRHWKICRERQRRWLAVSKPDIIDMSCRVEAGSLAMWQLNERLPFTDELIAIGNREIKMKMT